MIIYEDSIEQFNEDVTLNRIADRVSENYKSYYHKYPSDPEYRAFNYSLPILSNSFRYAGLKDNHVIVEYELPYSSSRIDVLLFGKDSKGEDNVVLMELKQWSNKHVKESQNEGNVIVDYGHFVKEQPHPSLQVEGYHFGLKDFLSLFDEKDAPQLSSCTYAHNYSKEGIDRVLYFPQFKRYVQIFPIFAKEEAVELSRYLSDKLIGGNGRVIYERFTGSPVKPTKRLLDHTSEMINKRQIFNLIDEQITAYNTIIHNAKHLIKSKDKSVIIVKGGPGTGKSVIALEVMGELLRQGKSVFHATGSSAFTNTLRKIVGTRARKLFNYFYSYTQEKESAIDVLVCDEAHRLRAHSFDFRVPTKFKSKNPQAEDLIKSAKLSVFFIDELQVVRPKEIGSIDLIKGSAKKMGVKSNNILEYELRTQFRCSGSDAYLQWLDNVLDLRKSVFKIFDKKMEFRIFDNPTAMMNEIRKRNIDKPNSARITAGFCWPWSEPNTEGTLVNDVKIGDFEMPWENKKEFWKWATDESGMEQVGTVYTAQGFEFDYIAVIFGNDLVYDSNAREWVAIPQNSYDSQVKRNNPNLTNHLKNVYRVLLSRAHKGVYVYFMDKSTREYFDVNLHYN